MQSEREVLQQLPGVTRVRLQSWISRGWLSPANSDDGIVFTELDVARCRLIREFRDELEIDRETLPVVLKLMDQVYDLRRELRLLTNVVNQQPADVRRNICDMVNSLRYGEG